MATEHGISRARAAAILRSVGCWVSRRPANRQFSLASSHPMNSPRLVHARELLVHPKASRLTIRQRAAVAWTALGLSSCDAAMQMGVSPQRVRYLLASAEARLRRQSVQATNEDRSQVISVPILCWDGLFESMTGEMPRGE